MSVYERAVEELSKKAGLVSHSVRWVSMDGEEGRRAQDALAACIDEFGEHPYANAPNVSIATVHIIECMKQRGWRYELVEEVILQD